MRDYSISGMFGPRAVDTALSDANWYHSDISREDMRALIARRNGPAIFDTLLLFTLMIGFLTGGIIFWGSWWAVPFWLAYGVLYGSAMDSRWHECGHATAFKSRRLNTWLYHIASFCMVRNPITWRWSHSRHHSNTIMVGLDPEIVAMRPPDLFVMGLNFVGFFDALRGWRDMFGNAFGFIDHNALCYIPTAERTKVYKVARVWVAIYGVTLVTVLSTGSLMPFMIIGWPRIYGAWHHVLTGVLQHAGLAEDVIDHRLNTRTVYLNPISRFIYWNMNYHVEHHMFPMVPYHALPKLHALIKHDLPAPNTSMIQAYREVWPVLKRQLQYEDYYLKRELPPSAKPYREYTPYKYS